MSSISTPDDEERMSHTVLVESVGELASEPPDPDSDTALLEQLLELLSIDESADDGDEDDDDIAEITSNFVHPSMSDDEIFEWQQSIPAESGTSLATFHMHTTRAPAHLQAERPTEHTHQASPGTPTMFLGSLMISRSPIQCLDPLAG